MFLRGHYGVISNKLLERLAIFVRYQYMVFVIQQLTNLKTPHKSL